MGTNNLRLGILTSMKINFTVNYDGQNKWMYFSIKDDDLSEKYSAIWDKISTNIKREFDSKPVYNKKFLKTKIKSHGDETTVFSDKKILRWTLTIIV